MRSSKKNMIGLSLIEAILALTIGGAILTMGIRLYNSFITDVSAQQVRYNVEEIMRAAAFYYYANCQLQNGTTNTATLDPNNDPAPSNPYTSVTVSSLVSAGYLMKAPPKNAIVDSSAAQGGYLIQFNNKQSTRYYCETSCAAGTGDPIGTNYDWQIQVSVKLLDTSKASQYQNLSGADCLTRTNGSGVFTCSAAGSTGNNYLSWERMPSMVSFQGQSSLWMTNPVTKQFKQYQQMQSVADMIANPNTKFLCGS